MSCCKVLLHIHLVRLDKYKKENRKFWINDKDDHLDKQVHDIMHACNFCILRHKNKGNFITVTLDFVWSIHECWFMIMDKFSIFIYCLCSSHLNQCCISPICYKTTRPATSPFWSITFQLEIVNMHINHYYKTMQLFIY